MLCILPVWICIKIGLPLSRKPVKISFTNGIRIYKTDLGFFQKYRTTDFLLEGKRAHSGNTLFYIETEILSDYRTGLEKRGIPAPTYGKSCETTIQDSYGTL
jgi:polysaccharide biosynthesis PFTS motif protein